MHEFSMFEKVRGLIRRNGVQSHEMNDGSTIANEEGKVNEPATIGAGRRLKLTHILRAQQINVHALREFMWSGCPQTEYSLHSQAWKVALGYLPARSDRFQEVTARKRAEYSGMKSQHQELLERSASVEDNTMGLTIRQIRLDTPRTFRHSIAVLSDDRLQEMCERVLILWSCNHPACGYVQGMNDAAIPLLVVLLEGETCLDISCVDGRSLDGVDLESVECDLFWMLTRLLTDIQDHYTFSQPGIQRMCSKLKDIVSRSDPHLAAHLEDEHVELMQVAFRWFNCLFTRELGIRSLLRVWDTCIAEPNGFSSFLVYVAAALIGRISADLKRSDFEEIMMTISGSHNMKLPLTETDVLLSEAFVLKSLYDSSPAHITPPGIQS